MSSEETGRTIRLAEKIVAKFCKKRLIGAMERVEKERCGKGCGCLSCARQSVDDINGWIDFIGAGAHDQNYLDRVRYRIETKRRARGGWKIVQGTPEDDYYEEDL